MKRTYAYQWYTLLSKPSSAPCTPTVVQLAYSGAPSPARAAEPRGRARPSATLCASVVSLAQTVPTTTAVM